MAITAAAIPNAPGGVQSDLAKAVVLTVPEADAVDTGDDFTFAAMGLGSFDAAPQVVSILEITDAAVVATNEACVSLYNITAAGFSVRKTSVAAGAVNHTFAVMFLLHRFFEV